MGIEDHGHGRDGARLGPAVESIDYRGIDDPAERVRKLIDIGREAGRAAGAGGLEPGRPCIRRRRRGAKARGLFLLAPAFYMPGFEQYTPQDVDCPALIVHGWHDDIVPVAEQHPLGARAPCDPASARLRPPARGSDPAICRLLRDFLRGL